MKPTHFINRFRSGFGAIPITFHDVWATQTNLTPLTNRWAWTVVTAAMFLGVIVYHRATDVPPEGKLRFTSNILPRWAVLGFAAKGKVNGDDAALKTQDDIVAGGIRGRYQFMPDEGFWLVVDVARGPEDTYMYITLGMHGSAMTGCWIYRQGL